MSRAKRIELIKELEEKRKSRIITYITSDRPQLHQQINADVVSILHEHILTIPKAERKKLDLFLYSRGGDSDIPWAIVSMFREYCDKGQFSVLIPYRAHSAATVIAIGADEVVMNKKAELGPIDITLTSPHNPIDEDTRQRLPISVEDVMGYFSLMDTVGISGNEKKTAYEIISSRVNPLALGIVSRLYQQTKLVAKRMLESRANRFDGDKIDEIVKRISTEIYSHRHPISTNEAIEAVGLSFCVPAESLGIEESMWSLYVEYRDFFKMESVFDPNTYLIEKDLDTYTWKNQSIACVESVSRFDLQTKSVTVNRIKNVPPQVAFELKGLSLPAITIPNLPNGITPDGIVQYINQILPAIAKQTIDRAVQEAVKEFIKVQPTAGYQRLDFATKWTAKN